MPAFIGLFLPTILPAYGPMLIGSLVILPVMLRRMLRPLRSVAAAAAQIDLRALDQRLPTQALPAELRPAITAINTALDRLAEGWARQSLFRANAAHELRTPVAIIQARIDAMAPDAPDPRHAGPRRQGGCARWSTNCSPSRAWTTGTACRTRRSTWSPPPARWSPIAPRSPCAPGAPLPSTPKPPAWVVRGDARAIEGAVGNLIDNALQAEPPGGTVDVTVHANPGALHRGPGPRPRHPARRSDAGVRAILAQGRTLRRHRPRLAAVREVARLHGGAITIEDTPKGGATFRLSFPASRAGGKT